MLSYKTLTYAIHGNIQKGCTRTINENISATTWNESHLRLKQGIISNV